MSNRVWMWATVPVLAFADVALAQYPIMDAVANTVIAKYQGSTCEQLWQQKSQPKSQPKSAKEQRVIKFLWDDPAMRTAFFDKVSGPIAYTTRYDVTMQRPDRLRVVIPGDGPASEFCFDGKTMMAFAPKENRVAVADAPPQIDAMLAQTYDKAAIFLPFGDFLATDPFTALAGGVKLAFVLGQSAARATTCAATPGSSRRTARMACSTRSCPRLDLFSPESELPAIPRSARLRRC